jgi:hypothetical protein
MYLFVLLALLSLSSYGRSEYLITQLGAARAVAINSNKTTCSLDAEQFKFTVSGSRLDMAYVKFVIPRALNGRRLSDLTSLNFDWCRPSDLNWHHSTQANGTYIQDWKYKSPFLRVLLSDGTQLVWEGYFNHQGTPPNRLIDQWISEKPLTGRWWAHKDGLYTTNELSKTCKMSPTFVWSGEVKSLSYKTINKCFGHLKVIGFSIGVGNQWPLSYQAYALPLRYKFR